MAVEAQPGRWSRRRVVARGGALAAVLALAGRGAAAATDGRAAFDTASVADVLAALGGTPVASAGVVLTLPAAVENGAFVPVSLESALPGTTEIAILVEANPNPLVALFDIPAGTDAWVSTRIKMAASCRVVGIVRADGRLYSASARVDVTTGGCG